MHVGFIDESFEMGDGVVIFGGLTRLTVLNFNRGGSVEVNALYRFSNGDLRKFI